MAKRRRRRRRRTFRARRPKFQPGDRVVISKISVAYRLAELKIPIGAGVHLVVRAAGVRTSGGGDHYYVGCEPEHKIPWAIGSRARSRRVDCMECLARHPDKV